MVSDFMNRVPPRARRPRTGLVQSTCKVCGERLTLDNNERVVPIRFKSVLYKPVGCERCSFQSNA